MNLQTALERDFTIRSVLGNEWQFHCLKLPDNNNVNATWTLDNCHISCSLYDDTEFHFSVCLGVGVSFVGTDKNPRLAALKASHKAAGALNQFQLKYNKLTNLLLDSGY